MVEMKKILFEETLGAILLLISLSLFALVGNWSNGILNFLLVFLGILFPILFILTIIIFKKIKKDKN